jgi:hypothetical protein
VFRCASCDEWINVVRDEKGPLYWPELTAARARDGLLAEILAAWSPT